MRPQLARTLSSSPTIASGSLTIITVVLPKEKITRKLRVNMEKSTVGDVVDSVLRKIQIHDVQVCVLIQMCQFNVF